MPQFATYDVLRRLTPPLMEARAYMEKAASKTYKDVFLSHSSKDHNFLPAVVAILENHGGSVYVDDGDDRLPTTPSPSTAAVLRRTIRDLSRFVVFVTATSKDSRWIPWELGLADAYKEEPQVALFPSEESGWSQSWANREYLGLYRRIVWGEIDGDRNGPGWLVWNHHENTGIQLRNWLRGY